MARKLPNGFRAFLFSLLPFLLVALILKTPADRGTALASEKPPIASAAEIDYPPFSYVGPDGRATGFSVELLRAALSAMNREVTFKTGPWSEVRQWLEKHEIDALPLVGRTPERDRMFDFTVPYMTLHGAIVVRTSDTGKIRGIDDLKGLDVAVMQGDNAEEFLRRKDRGIHILTTSTFTEAFQILSQGGCDAVVIQRLVALRLLRETSIPNLSIINPPIEDFRQDFCFAVTEGDRDTLALLNEGLAIIAADGTQRHLHAKWFAALELPENRSVIIGGDYNFPPFEFLDENGLPAGFNVDLTRAIARETDMDIEIRLGSWSKIVEDLAAGEIDGIQGMFYSPERDQVFDFTPPHIVNHCIAVIRKNGLPMPDGVDDLADLRIVVQKGDIMHDFAMKNGLSDRLSLVDAQENALRDLSEGKQDCALAARTTALYWIKKNGWDNLAVGEKPLLSPQYCYAVPHNNIALLAQLSEGLKIIHETGEYRRIYEKWMGGYEPLTPDFFTILRYAALVIVPLTMLLLGFFIWNRSLRNQVAARTEALRKREEFLRALIECSPVALYSIDLEARVSAWNATAERVFGWTTEEILGNSFPIVPEEKKSEFEALRGRMLAGEIILGMEVVRRKKDGALFDGSLSAAPIRDKNGDIIGFMGAMEDITERKRIEQAMVESERKWRNILVNTPQIGISLDPRGRIIFVNHHFSNLTGWTAREVLGRDWFDICIPKDIREEVRRIFDHVMATKDAVGITAYENEILTKTGETLNIAWSNVLTLDVQGTVMDVTCLGVDLTERKRAEAALKKSEEQYRLLADNTIDAIWTMNMDLVFTYVNPACLAMTGHTPEEWIGSRLRDHCDDKNFEIMANKVMDGMEAGPENPGLIFEAEMIKKNGEPLPVEIHGKIIYDDKGRPVMIQGVTRDISERRHNENAREKLQTQLIQAQKMESLGRLAGGVAHDFNNMLSVILGYAELIQGKIPQDNPIYEDILEILAAGRRSADITQQLLAFARQQVISPKVLDLNEIVEGVLKMLRRLIGEDIDLTWHPRPGLWHIKMDPSQINQILANLCVNAKDAIIDVGKITIETDQVSFDESYCADHTGFTPGDFVMLAVTDNGCGMDPQTLEKIYEPFFTTKQVGQGTGLGLTTVYGIVKQNNGWINTYSEPGSGTTFKLYFPRHMGEPMDAPDIKTEIFPEGHGETLLIVEDDAMILSLTEKMLSRLGYRTLTASSPAEALEVGSTHGGSIDLVLTDVIMPGMNGRDLSERLKGLYPNIRVLFMSGYTADVIAHHGILENGVLFLEKPFSLKNLAVRVREALTR